MTAHVAHSSVGPVVHNGPGHRFGDPGYCGGCWWEQIGQYQPSTPGLPHADNCPGCRQ